MSDSGKPGYYAVIPAQVRYDKTLRPNAKLLYGELTALAGADGYCWASNQYFAELYSLSVSTVSELIKSLEVRGYIKSEMSSNSKGSERHIYAGAFMVLATGGGSSEKSEDPPPGGLPKNPKRGLPIFPKPLNDNNINNTNNPLPPNAKILKSMPSELVAQMQKYAGNDDELLRGLLAFAELRQRLKKPIVTTRTLTLLLNKLDKLSGGGRVMKLRLIDKATEHGWLTFYPLKEDEYSDRRSGAARVTSPEVEEW